jgi:hypothetical protein
MNQELLRHNPDYVRLPGGGLTSAGMVSYWLARDHLLVVEVQVVSESYRRIELRDFQSLSLLATWTHLWSSILLGVIAIGMCGFSLVTFSLERANGFSEPSGIVVVFGVISMLLTAGLVASLRRGIGCRTELQTSVQTIPLAGLRRWRKAEQFLAAITPAIQAAQAHLPKSADITPQPELAPSPGDPLVPTEN